MKIEIAILECLMPVTVREKYHAELEPGESVSSIAPEGSGPGWAVILEGKSHVYSNWESITPIAGDQLIFVRLPGEALTWAMITEALVNAVVSMAISYVAADLLGVFEPPETLEADDPVYAFSGIQNRTESGMPIPIVYGTHKVGGNYLETNLTGNNPYQTGNQYGNTLDVIVGVSEGPIDAWLDLTINGNSISNYLAPTVTADYRYGDLTQTAHDTIGTTSVVTVDQELLPGGGTADISTWTRGPSLSYSTGAKVNQVNLNILHYNGLVESQSDGDVFAVPVDVEWRYRTSDTGSGAGAWTDWADFFIPDTYYLNIGAITSGPFQRLEVVTGGTSGATGTVAIDTADGTSPLYIFTWQNTGQGTFQNGETITGSISGATATISGTQQQTPMPDYWARFTALSFSPFTSTVELPLPTFDFYDIEVARFTTWGPDIYRRTGINLDGVVEIQYNDLTYPGVASTRLVIQADRSMNSDLPRIISEVRGRKIQRWNGATWEDDSPDYCNPAWVVYDLLTNTRYGLGNWIDASMIDLVSFKSWGDWCAELVDDGYGGSETRCRFDGVFGASGLDSWTAILRVCATARAVLVMVGDTIKIKYEYDRTPTQLFTMGNIVEGSWAQEYISRVDRPTRYEIKYLNAAADYQSDVVGVDDPDSTLAGEPQRPKAIDLIGITRESQALREARFRMNVEKLNQTVEFEADIDAVACEPGDLIMVAHDVPQWGHSGRVVAGGATTIQLDRDVTLDSGITYEVMIRTSGDDNRETRTISSAAGDYAAGSDLTLSLAWTVNPAQFDLYSFGRQNITSRPIVISEIVTQGDLSRKIKGAIYDAAIHEDSIGQLDTITYSDLPDPAIVPGCVSNLTAVEVSGIDTMGQPRTQVLAGWTYPDGVNIWSAQVWARVTGTTTGGVGIPTTSDDYSFQGEVEWPGNSFMLDDLIVGADYEITVLAVSPAGASKQVGDCSSVLITPQGVASIPASPLNVTVSRSGPLLTISWDAVENVSVSLYEVRRGSTWNGSTFLGQTNSLELTTGNWAPTINSTTGGNTQVDEVFFVRAISLSQQYGTIGTGQFSDPLPVWGSSGNLTQHNDRIVGLSTWPGSKTNLTVNTTTNELELTTPGVNGVYQSSIDLDMGGSRQWTLGVVLQWRQVTTKTWTGSTAYDWSSAIGQDSNWSGSINPDLWETTAQIDYAISSNDVTYSDWIPFNETQLIYGATVASVWINSWRYVRVRVTFNVTSSTVSPVMEELFITGSLV